MADYRIKKLAQNLIQHSIQVQPKENILIEMIGQAKELVQSLIEEITQAGGRAHVQIVDPAIQRKMIMHNSEDMVEDWTAFDLARMKKMDGYIGIRAYENINELSDVPKEKMQFYNKEYAHKVHSEQRVKHTKWVVLRYPNPSMAQLANTSNERFENLYFDVCSLDYNHMDQAMNPLKELMEKTNKVRIVSPGTDLTFSISNMNAIKCAGRHNIPDGEVFTAPIRDSVQGTIQYNAPSMYNGVTFNDIFFRFENGKIVEAKSTRQKELEEILDTDEGARYIGEFAIGLNPHVLYPINDILFDEKITGSIHFTPGQAYEEADNQNRSAIHWDLVLIQRPEYGGGEIYFDDVLIRKDGRFVIESLQGLNPENLMSSDNL